MSIVISDPQHTQSAKISQKQYERIIHAIMKAMCPSSYHHNGSVATHALAHMMYELPQSNCGDNREGALFSYICI